MYHYTYTCTNCNGIKTLHFPLGQEKPEKAKCPHCQCNTMIPEPPWQGYPSSGSDGWCFTGD